MGHHRRSRDSCISFRPDFLHCGDLAAPNRTAKDTLMDAAAETLKPQAEAAKATADQFATAANTAFKDGVEKTLAALTEVNTDSKKNLEAAVAAVSAAAKGAETLGAQA